MENKTINNPTKERLFTAKEVGNILKCIIRYSNEPGRLCGGLDRQIRAKAKKHGIRV